MTRIMCHSGTSSTTADCSCTSSQIHHLHHQLLQPQVCPTRHMFRQLQPQVCPTHRLYRQLPQHLSPMLTTCTTNRIQQVCPMHHLYHQLQQLLFSLNAPPAPRNRSSKSAQCTTSSYFPSVSNITRQLLYSELRGLNSRLHFLLLVILIRNYRLIFMNDLFFRSFKTFFTSVW